MCRLTVCLVRLRPQLRPKFAAIYADHLELVLVVAGGGIVATDPTGCCLVELPWPWLSVAGVVVGLVVEVVAAAVVLPVVVVVLMVRVMVMILVVLAEFEVQVNC